MTVLEAYALMKLTEMDRSTAPRRAYYYALTNAQQAEVRKHTGRYVFSASNTQWANAIVAAHELLED